MVIGGWSLVIGDRREKRGPAIEGPTGQTARAETAVFENGSKKRQRINAGGREEDSTLRHRGHRAEGINGKRSFSREPKASAWRKKAPSRRGKMKARRHEGTEGHGAKAMGCVRIIPRSPRAPPGVLLRPGDDRIYGTYAKGIRLPTNASRTILDSLISEMAVL